MKFSLSNGYSPTFKWDGFVVDASKASWSDRG